MSRVLSAVHRPDISQSDVQMMLYYSVCRIEAATLHLLSQEKYAWPTEWHKNMAIEFVSQW